MRRITQLAFTFKKFYLAHYMHAEDINTGATISSQGMR